MKRGTTPTLNLSFDYSLDELDIKAFFITFSQDGEVVLEKDLEQVQVNGNTITINLSQEDTLKFKGDKILKIQVRFRTDSGAFVTNLIKTNVEEILKDGVI